MKKKIFALLTALCMTAAVLPAVFADGEGEPTIGMSEQEQCSCVTLCTEGNINSDCPICSAENADLTACKGEPLAPVLLGAPRSTVKVTYLDENGDEQEAEAAEVPFDLPYMWQEWYVARGDVTIPIRIEVRRNVNLILADGCTLTINGGIEMMGTNSLTIYAQSTGSSMGELIAQVDIGSCNAGIGGNGWSDGGTITINGGKITANGGTSGAGIGGSDYGSGGTVIINGGVVNATGGDNAAGIGGGSGGSGGTVIINGGVVNATGGTAAAGIGGGMFADGGTITISGGEVTAIGDNGSAGIGGGEGGDGGTITIEGGVVNATGGSNAAGIGSGKGNNGGSFSTGTDGNAIIFASGGKANIEDTSQKDSWQGIIFEGNEGAVYSTNVTLTEDFIVPAGKTLTIGQGKTLTIEEGKTLTIQTDATLIIQTGATLTNSGTILVESGGKLEGKPIGDGTVKFAPTITTTSLPNGTVDTAYSQTLEATGDPTITWSLDSGSSLPVGLTLRSDGTISGTPTVAGSSNFTVIATNDSGTDSKELTLTIGDVAPTITTHPADQIVTEGEKAEFTVTATGTGLTYQWQQKTNGGAWTEIADATDATYTIAATTLSMNGYQYRCVVKNSTDTQESTAATLTVQQASVPIPPQPSQPTDTEHTVQTDNSGHAPVEDNTSLPSFWDLVTQRINATPRGGEITINTGARAVPDSVLNALRARSLTATFRYGDTELTLTPDQLPPEGTLTEWTLRELGNYLTEADESIRISEEKSEAENATATETAPAADTGKPNPATGETTTTAAAMLVAVVALTGLGVTLKRK